MSTQEILNIIKSVLLNPFVIGTAVVVILYMNFCSFVCNYTKKEKKFKKKRSVQVATPEPEKKENSEENSESNEE